MEPRVRQGLKRERKRARKANREMRKLRRALIPLQEMPPASGSSATSRCEYFFAMMEAVVTQL